MAVATHTYSGTRYGGQDTPEWAVNAFISGIHGFAVVSAGNALLAGVPGAFTCNSPALAIKLHQQYGNFIMVVCVPTLSTLVCEFYCCVPRRSHSRPSPLPTAQRFLALALRRHSTPC